MNYRAMWAIYSNEMMRGIRTVAQSLASPVISTALYFLVFGTAIGSRMPNLDGVEYGSFIVPGLILLSVMSQAVANASFGIYFPKFIGSFYEVQTAPLGSFEIIVGYVGAAATKSLVIGLVILGTAYAFVSLTIVSPVLMLVMLLVNCVAFSMLGFIIGVWAKSFEQLQIVPLLIITPMVFLGGSFYSITMLPELWQTISLFNPMVYLISGFRWAFFGTAEIDIALTMSVSVGILVVCTTLIWWTFHTGFRVKK